MNQTKWTITKDVFLSLDQVRQLYAMLKDAKDLAVHRQQNFVHVRDNFILRTLLETGLRVAELCALKIGDFQAGSIIVQRGKGGKKRTIILSKGTQRMLKEFLKVKQKVLAEPIDPNSPLFLSERRGPYTTRAIRKRVKFWFRRCSFSENLSCHSCRHSYVSHLIANKVDLTTVRDNAGHSSLAVTSIYSHAVKDELDVDLYGE
jgi:site-specific recombinase XerD